MITAGDPRAERLILACHYPVDVPDAHARELAGKRLINARDVRRWLATIGPHLYCCGHVHAAWAFRPADLPGQLCLNPGAPLLWSHSGRQAPGFLEIVLDGRDVAVHHHAWTGEAWDVSWIHREPGFFPAGPSFAGGRAE